MVLWLQKALRHVRKHWQETLICLALVIWTFGQVTFGLSSDQTAIAPLSKLNLENVYKPLTICILMTVILVRGLHMRPIGYVGIALLVGTMVVSYQRTGYIWQLVLLLFLLAIKGVRLEVLFRFYLGALLAAFVTVLVLSSLPTAMVRFYTPNGFLVSSYGFKHPNTYGFMIFAITTAMALSFDLRRAWLPLAVLCVVCGLFAFFLLSCRTVAVLEIGLALFVVAYGLWRDPIDRLCSFRVTQIVVAAFPIVLACVLLVMLLLYMQGNDFAVTVDRLVSKRITQACEMFEREGVFTLFGRAHDSISLLESYTTVKTYVGTDSAYFHYPLVEGIASMVCWAVVYVRAVLKGKLMRSKAIFMAIAVLYSAYFVTENAPTFLTLTCSLLVLSEGIYAREGAFAASQERTAIRGRAMRLAFPAVTMVVLIAAMGFTFVLSRSNGTGQRSASEDFPAETHAVLTNAPGTSAGETSEVFCETTPDGLMNVTFAGLTLQGTPHKIYTKEGMTYYSFKHPDSVNHIMYAVLLSKPVTATPSNPSGTWSARVASSKGMVRGFSLSLGQNGAVSLTAGPYDTFSTDAKQLPGSTDTGTWTSKSDGGHTTIEGDMSHSHLTVDLRLGQQ